MKVFIKVVCIMHGGKKKILYYEAQSVCMLVDFFSIAGGPCGAIVEMKEVARLPKGVEAEKGYFD